jgi:hypothetical protein
MRSDGTKGLEVPEPWWSFLDEVDAALSAPVEVHCLGGFVLGILWGLPRPTADVDVVAIRPSRAADELLRVAGEGSEIARKRGIHFQQVTIAECPADYETRLADLAAGSFRNLRVRAFEVHDVVLSKLGRNGPRDRSDVQFLVDRGALHPEILRERFKREMRPYVLNADRTTRTLSLWLEEFFERGGA